MASFLSLTQPFPYYFFAGATPKLLIEMMDELGRGGTVDEREFTRRSRRRRVRKLELAALLSLAYTFSGTLPEAGPTVYKSLSLAIRSFEYTFFDPFIRSTRHISGSTLLYNQGKTCFVFVSQELYGIMMPPAGTLMRDETDDRPYYSCHLVCISSSRDSRPDTGVGTWSLSEFAYRGFLGTEVGSGDEIYPHYGPRCFKQGPFTGSDSNYSRTGYSVLVSTSDAPSPPYEINVNRRAIALSEGNSVVSTTKVHCNQTDVSLRNEEEWFACHGWNVPPLFLVSFIGYCESAIFP
ncbi:uncharacterized protein ARMOST_20389 [Armillaria ostoyae]|uniref:Uncharacterized protein n=1 Tax=Armillaria ostoyae TaxID=47428 RepID=A0A284S785_ARMOS|nr:uncharacterized protein ARMOST_20389 [Armillaria ostoyae]